MDATPGRGTRVTIVAPLRGRLAPRQGDNFDRPAGDGRPAATFPQDSNHECGKEQRQPLCENTECLLVDDHPLVRRGVADVIAREADLEICGEAATWPEAMQAVERVRIPTWW